MFKALEEACVASQERVSGGEKWEMRLEKHVVVGGAYHSGPPRPF